MLPQVDPLGRVYVTALGTPVSWNAGVGYDALGRMCTTILLGPNDQYVNGWRLDPLGRVVVDAASANLVYNGGLPFNNQAPLNGTMARSIDVAPSVNDPYVNGMRIGAGGVYFTTAAIPPPPVPFNIATFFGAARGGWYDFTDPTVLFEDTAGTDPAEVNDPIARIVDKSPNNGSSNQTLLQTTVGNRPIWVATSGLNSGSFLAANNQRLDGGDVSFGSAAGMVAIAAIKTPAGSGERAILGSDLSTGRSFTFKVDTGYLVADIVQSNGVIRRQLTNAPELAVDTIAVVTLWVENLTVRFRVNGVNKVLHGTSVPMTVAMGSVLTEYMVGATQGGTTPGAGFNPFSGNIYVATVMDRSPTLAEISAAEQYIGSLVGVAVTPALNFVEEMSVAHELTVGINPGGNRVGYRKNEWGDWQPDDIPSLLRLYTNLNNNRLVVQAEGDKSALVVSNIHIVRFSPFTVFDFGPPNSVVYDGVNTDFTWIVPGFDFVLGENYEVSLS